jgi:hypothetical protein
LNGDSDVREILRFCSKFGSFDDLDLGRMQEFAAGSGGSGTGATTASSEGDRTRGRVGDGDDNGTIGRQPE